MNKNNFKPTIAAIKERYYSKYRGAAASKDGDCIRGSEECECVAGMNSSQLESA